MFDKLKTKYLRLLRDQKTQERIDMKQLLKRMDIENQELLTKVQDLETAAEEPQEST